jgi:DNA-binding transcriptional MerR regulator
MASPARSSPAPRPEPEATTWPHQLSHAPSLKVSDVLRILGGEFPALSPSKLRFFDAQGLVTPQRTASGYRQYSASDVERLRFVLREQRDFYRPLSVIQATLERLDAGVLRRAITPGDAQQEAAAFVPAKTLAALAGAAPEFVAELEAQGMISASVPGGFDRRLAAFVAAVDSYVALGGSLREARLLGHAAAREVAQASAASGLADVRKDPLARKEHQAARVAAAAALFAASIDALVDRSL